MQGLRIILLLGLAAIASAGFPSKYCQFAGEHLRDIYDNCFFFRCVPSGAGFIPYRFQCAPGTGVPANFVDFGTQGSPCSEFVTYCGVDSAKITPIPTTTAAPTTTTTAAPTTTTTAAPTTTTTAAPTTTTTAAPTTAGPTTTTAGPTTASTVAPTTASTVAPITTTTAAPTTTTTAAPATTASTATAPATTTTVMALGNTIPDSGCPAPFSRTDSANVAGGILISNITTMESCKEQCILMLDCEAIDFNTHLNQCFMHTTSTLGILNMGVGNVVHFRKTACVQNFGLPAGYLSVSTGQHILSGTQQAGTFDLNSCLTACNQTSGCVAVDYNAEGSCWFHTNVTACNALVSKAFCQHYKRVQCFTGSPAVTPAPPTGYSSFITGYHIFGGSVQTGSYSLSGCLAACDAAPGTCLSVDYNYADGSCWFHGLTTSCNTLYAKQLCSHFAKTSCTVRQERIDY